IGTLIFSQRRNEYKLLKMNEIANSVAANCEGCKDEQDLYGRPPAPLARGSRHDTGGAGPRAGDQPELSEPDRTECPAADRAGPAETERCLRTGCADVFRCRRGAADHRPAGG